MEEQKQNLIEGLNKAAEEYANAIDEKSPHKWMAQVDFIAGAKWMESQFELIHGKEEGEEYGFTFNKNAPLDVYIRKKDE